MEIEQRKIEGVPELALFSHDGDSGGFALFRGEDEGTVVVKGLIWPDSDHEVWDESRVEEIESLPASDPAEVFHRSLGFVGVQDIADDTAMMLRGVLFACRCIVEEGKDNNERG